MSDLLQLDAAAALVGKSEVTLRRLIKAGKIPVQKEKTLTGFIYLVKASDVKEYYAGRGEELSEKEELPEPVETQVAEEPAPAPSARRLAVSGESGDSNVYWQKRAEMYEDKYHQEVQKGAQIREELGTWRGRAEQAQSMLMKMLPAPEVLVKEEPSKEAAPTVQANQKGTFFFTIIIAIALLLMAGILAYSVFFPR